MLGGGPGDEGQPPDDVELTLFDFCGYGQPSGNAGDANGDHNNEAVDHGLAPQWRLWPDGPQGNEDGPFIGPEQGHGVPVVQALAAPMGQNPPEANNNQLQNALEENN